MFTLIEIGIMLFGAIAFLVALVLVKDAAGDYRDDLWLRDFCLVLGMRSHRNKAQSIKEKL